MLHIVNNTLNSNLIIKNNIKQHCLKVICNNIIHYIFKNNILLSSLHNNLYLLSQETIWNDYGENELNKTDFGMLKVCCKL